MNSVLTRLSTAAKPFSRRLLTSASDSSKSGGSSTFGPLQYAMMGLAGAGIVGAMLREQSTLKTLGLKRSPTQAYDMNRRPTGEYATMTRKETKELSFRKA